LRLYYLAFQHRTRKVNDSTNNSGNTRPKRKWLFPLGVAAIAISSIVVVSCFHDDDPTTTTGGTDTFTPTEPAPLNVTGTSLFCNTGAPPTSTVAASYVAEQADNPPDMNISKDPINHNSGNNLKRLETVVVVAEDPAGEPVLDPVTNAEFEVHPIIVSFGEQVIGEYEGGDGSADIGDPDNIDDIFTSLSLDNGKTWKKANVSGTAKNSDTGQIRSSTIVTWNGERIPYPGHSHKPTMAVWGNNILVAWNDKYCPSGDPFDLVDNTTGELVDPDQPDYFKVNGSQGSIDYGGIVAPNDKLLYEVPFSCVWTARGVFDATDAADGDGILEIQWRQAQQLTSGTRDSNKIWIAAEEAGFVLAWQEDTEGLRSGKGLGPGEGYSGATTNHGTDIWYTYIAKDEFDDVCSDAECTASTDVPADIEALGEKPKPAVNFAYAVRITNNETCTTETDGETKLYCADNCDSTVALTTGNSSGTNINRCVQNDLDYMTQDDTVAPAAAVLDGDTGASRPALKILRTNSDTPEYVTILAYEETKGLSESDPADQGTTETDIKLEGKAVYFESFFWDQPVTVSAGRVVNQRVPEVTIADDGTYAETGLMIYENARRVVIMPQVDACEMVEGNPTFALMYKQGYATQGGPSDMFVRVNYGFTYDEFGLLDGRDPTNVSAHDNEDVDNGTGQVIWTTDYLEHQSYEQPFDNTFSPRGWLRAGEVYNGFEFSPRWKATSTGTVPNNFWMHRFVDSAWQGPKQLSIVTGAQVSTLDPRFVPTPQARHSTIESDKSNPDVIFMGYGTFDMTTSEELDLLYTRSTDKGVTWEYIDAGGAVIKSDAGLDRIPGTDDDEAVRVAKLSAEADVHEMEVQALATPDGTMMFGAWLRETPEVCGSPECGMDSRFGLVNYVDPTTIAVPE
jgi:hypothetical protein